MSPARTTSDLPRSVVRRRSTLSTNILYSLLQHLFKHILCGFLSCERFIRLVVVSTRLLHCTLRSHGCLHIRSPRYLGKLRSACDPHVTIPPLHAYLLSPITIMFQHVSQSNLSARLAAYHTASQHTRVCVPILLPSLASSRLSSLEVLENKSLACPSSGEEETRPSQRSVTSRT